MGLAIGFARHRRQAAEPEIFGGGIADRPFAGALGQFHQRQTLGALFDFADRGQSLGRDFVGGRLRRQGLTGGDDGLADRQGDDRGGGGGGHGGGGGGMMALRIGKGMIVAVGAAATGAGCGRSGAVAGARGAAAGAGSAARGGSARGATGSTRGGGGAATGAAAAGAPAPPPSSRPLPAPTRFDRPRRWTLPITALRVTPPNSLAIWLADWPSAHIFLSVSTRSSVQDMGNSGSGGRWALRPVFYSGWHGIQADAAKIKRACDSGLIAGRAFP